MNIVYYNISHYKSNYKHITKKYMKSKEPNKQYQHNLIKQFTQIFHNNEDFMQAACIQIPRPNHKRLEILLAEYPMEKKGKKFNTLQERIFKIENKVLQQIDKTGKKKVLPFPSTIQKQYLTQSSKSQWGILTFTYRLLLEFQQRNHVYVYMRTKQEMQQIFGFLLSKAKPIHKLTLTDAYNKIYKQKLAKYFLSKFSKLRMSQSEGDLDKKRTLITQKIRTSFNGENMLKQMILQWHKKAAMSNQNLEKGMDGEKVSWMSLKKVVTELSFNLQEIRTMQQYQIEKGQVKLWVGQMTHNKTVKFDKITHNQYSERNEQNQNNPFQYVRIFDLSESEMKVKGQSPLLNIWTLLQFQVQVITSEQNIQVWKSQRFYTIDFLKTLTAGPKKTITLWNNKRFIQLMLTATSAKSQALKIQLPPQHQAFPSSYTYNLTPNQYPILRQIIPKSILRKYIKSLSTETIHIQYIIAYQQYLQTQSIQSLSFLNFQKLYQLLNVDTIIQKFYTAQPYIQYANVEHKGTFVYEYLLKKSEKFSYYDAEKFIWKYQCTNFRRFLSVIKAFDQFPRINYTQPFYNICLQCLKISQKQSLIKWKSNLFSNTLIGRQSLAFFLVLAILKISSQLLLYQSNKKILSNNSLLFHYVLKKHNRKLYNKFLQIQLNIQTLFGIQSVSLFSGLFNTYNNSNNSGIFYGGSDQVFMFALNSFILERREQVIKTTDSQVSQNPSQNNSQFDISHARNNHYISLVAMFLAIIQLFDIIISKQKSAHRIDKENENDQIVGNSAAYSSPSSYIQYLKIFVRTKIQIYMLEITILYKKYYRLCQEEFIPKSPSTAATSQNQNQASDSNLSEYIVLQQNLGKFHIACRPSTAQPAIGNSQPLNITIPQGISNMNLGQLLEQLYSQFLCYKPKNEADIRKICILIDNINLGEYININNLQNNLSLSQANTLTAGYRPPSLIIQLFQQNTKIYEHQLVINNKIQQNKTSQYSHPSSTKNIQVSDDPNSIYINNNTLYYENIKHPIQLKLNKLSPIHLIVTYTTNTPITNISNAYNNFLSFMTIIDPTAIPSNYYTQFIRQLQPITNIQNNTNKIVYENKVTDIRTSRYICMQVHIKDSCDVDYLENLVPNQYINLLLLKDRISSNDHSNNENKEREIFDLNELQEYKKDIIFCNHYFRSFRLPQNNFNLLYAKLGWYGNHYLLPSDRINSIYFITHNPPSSNKQSIHMPFPVTHNTSQKILRNHQPSLAAVLDSNSCQIQIKHIPTIYRQRINEILYYTRCIYGRGLVPSISYPITATNPNNTNTCSSSILIQSVRSNKLYIKQCKQLKHEINQYQYNSCSNLVGYLFDNFNTINTNNSINNSNDGFIDFYLRCTEQLPLLRYLTFRTLQFYLLEEVKMTLHIETSTHKNANLHHSLSQSNLLNNISSRLKNKIVSHSQSPSPSSSPQSLHKIKSNQPHSHTKNTKQFEYEIEDVKIFQIVFTNFSIHKYNDHNRSKENQEMPNKFITDSAYFNTEIYNNYAAQNETIYSPKFLYIKLLEGIELPDTMYFTYPQGLRSNMNNSQDMEGLGGICGIGNRELLLDQFLWLIKMNIVKYYIVNKEKKYKDSESSQSLSLESKQGRDKLKKKTKKSPLNNEFDCQLKITNGNFLNIPVSSFFQFICQTKYGIDLAAIPILPLNIAEITHSSKSTSIQPQYPLILNPVYRHYTSYANLNNIWISVCILAKVISPNYEMFYTQEKYSRKYRLYRNTEIILGIEGKRMLNQIPVFKFTDLEVISGKGCVKKELLKIL